MSVATGMLAGALFVVGSRVLEDWLGRTPFTHAAVGVVPAIALVVGVWMGGRIADARGTRVAAWSLLAAGCWGLAGVSALGWLAHRWLAFLDAPGRSPELFLAVLPLISLVVLGIPMMGVGVASQLWRPARARPSAERPGHCWGRGRSPVLGSTLLFVMGALAGAWVTGGFILPEAGVWSASPSEWTASGVERVLRGSALWAGLLACLILWRVAKSARGRLLAVLPMVLAVVLTVVSAGSSVPLLSLGLFGRWAGRHDGFSGGVLLRHTDGRFGAVSMEEHPDFGKVLLRDGTAVAYGTRYRSGRILAAHIPLFLHTDARRVALVGPAAGVILPSVCTHPLEGIDCFTSEKALALGSFDVSPETTTNRTRRGEASQLPVRPDHRVTIRQQTGVTEGRSSVYDVLWISTAPAWESGAADALKPGFLKRCRRSVTEEGLVVLQLDTRGYTDDDFRRALCGFHVVFPHVQVWCLGREQWLWIGRARPIKAPADRMLERLDVEPVFRDLLRAGVRSLPELLAGFVCDTTGVETLTAGRGSVSPFRLAWHGLRSRFSTASSPVSLATMETVRSWRLGWLLPGQMDPDLFVALLNRLAGRLRGRAEAVQGCLADPATAGSKPAAPPSPDFSDDVLTRERLDKVDLEARRLLARHDLPGAVRRYEEMLRLSPDLAQAQYGLALAVRASGQLQSAFWHLASAVQRAPENGVYRLELGRTALQLGQIPEAVRQLRLVLSREPANAEALLLLSRARAAGAGSDRDVYEALRLAKQAYAIAQNPEYAWNLADRYIDAGEVRTGVELKRRLRQAEACSSGGRYRHR